MSAVLCAFVQCDMCESSEQADYGTRTIKQARADCRRVGWHRTRDGKDWCPVCWDERRAVTGEQAQP